MYAQGDSLSMQPAKCDCVSQRKKLSYAAFTLTECSASCTRNSSSYIFNSAIIYGRVANMYFQALPQAHIQ